MTEIQTVSFEAIEFGRILQNVKNGREQLIAVVLKNVPVDGEIVLLSWRKVLSMFEEANVLVPEILSGMGMNKLIAFE